MAQRRPVTYRPLTVNEMAAGGEQKIRPYWSRLEQLLKFHLSHFSKIIFFVSLKEPACKR